MNLPKALKNKMELNRTKARDSSRAQCPSGRNHPYSEGLGFRPQGIKKNVSLARYTTLRIGGRARYWYEPKNKFELACFLKNLSLSLPIFVIGRGSNLLVKEGLINKVFIHLRALAFNKIEIRGGLVTAGAGVQIARLVSFLTKKDLSGYEFLAGIPGTVGGVLAMNAGAKMGAGADAPMRQAADIVFNADVLDREGNLLRLKKKDIKFSYRNSSLKGAVIIAATFKLKKGDKEKVKQRIREILHKRIIAQDWEHPSAGSFFKNPGKDISAGRLIDECGLKGISIGQAAVSRKHANFIINKGRARSSQVIKLMEKIQACVYNRYKVKLQPEVEIVS